MIIIQWLVILIPIIVIIAVIILWSRSNLQVLPKASTVGVQVQQPQQTSQGNYTKVIPKDPGIAAVLSFLFAGLGQIYNGQIAKGLLFIVIQCINVALMLVVIGFITFPIFWVYGIYDAHKVAKATHGL